MSINYLFTSEFTLYKSITEYSAPCFNATKTFLMRLVNKHITYLHLDLVLITILINFMIFVKCIYFIYLYPHPLCHTSKVQILLCHEHDYFLLHLTLVLKIFLNVGDFIVRTIRCQLYYVHVCLFYITYIIYVYYNDSIQFNNIMYHTNIIHTHNKVVFMLHQMMN